MKYCEKPVLTELGLQLSHIVADTAVTVGLELYTTKPAASDKRLIRTLDQQLNDSSISMEHAFAASYIDPPQLLSPPVSMGDRMRPMPATASPALTPTASSTMLTNGSLYNSVNPNGGAHNGGISKRRTYSTPSLTATIGSPFGSLAEVGNIKQYAYLIAALNASDPDRDFSALQPSSFHRIYSDILAPMRQTIDSLGLKTPPNLWTTIEEEITPHECKVYWLELPQQFLEDDDSGISWSKNFFFFNKRRKRVLFVYMNSRPASYHRESSSDSEAILGELD